jgi:gamma-glutamylputrescine oxidase
MPVGSTPDALPLSEPGWGEPPWRIPLALGALPPPARCDVAVVGGGFAGLSAAYHLACRGARVALLEAAEIGAGASGRTGGIALEGTAAGPAEQVEHCLDTLASVVAEAGIDAELDLPGCTEVRHVGAAPSRGSAWRDGDQWIVPVGTEPGGTVHPAKLVAGLATAALRAGATVHTRWPVHAIERTTAREFTLRGPHGGTVGAEHVAIAINAYMNRLVPLDVEFRSALTLALCTAPLEPARLEAAGLGHRPFYTTDLPYLWGRALRDRRVVFGSGLVFPPDGDVRRTGLGSRAARETMSRLERRVRSLHPALDRVEVTHRWGGPIAFIAGMWPILSRLPDAPDQIVTGAFAGHGVALSVRIGQLIAGALLDGTPLPAWGALSRARSPSIDV